jgi:hypothetical protein
MSANPKVKGNRVRACFVNDMPFESIREAAEELARLKKGISYWMLYRALRKHKPQIGDVSIALADEIRTYHTPEPAPRRPGDPLVTPVHTRPE